MKAHRHGFVLIIALGLMAFVLLTLISLITFIQVENRTAKVNTEQIQARMNARLAVLLGLGELQKYAGADQRVTATADILIPPNVDPLNPIAGGFSEGSLAWTGVWSSNAEYNNPAAVKVTVPDYREYRPDAIAPIYSKDLTLGLTPGLAGIPLPKWLVSGDLGPRASLNDANSVVLVSVDNALTSGDPTTRQKIVRAPLEEIAASPNSPGGQYAYWIGDEGVKARINKSSPYLDMAGDKAYYEVNLAQAADPSALLNRFTMGSPLFLPRSSAYSKWKSGKPAADSIFNRNALSFLAEVSGDAAHKKIQDEYFHDFTAVTNSLMTNTKRGGFKKDLTLALEEEVIGIGPMFPPLVSGQKMDPGGPRWEQLIDYYKLSDSLSGTSGTVAMRVGKKDNVSSRVDRFNNQINIAPVVTRLQMIVQMFSQRKASAGPVVGSPLAKDYDYYFGFFPLVTLWNPYDKAMNIGEIMMTSELSCHVDLLLLNPGNPYESEASILHKERMLNQWKYFDFISDENRSGVSFTIRASRPIPAGESVNFMPAYNSLYAFNLTNRAIASLHKLSEGTTDGIDLLKGFFVPYDQFLSSTPVPDPNDPSVQHKLEDVRWRFSNNSGYPSDNLWNLVTCFYSKVEDVKRVPGNNKFISMMHPGYGKTLSEKVIDITDLSAGSFDFSKLKEQHDDDVDPSLIASRQAEVTPFDLDGISSSLGNSKILGFAINFNFPKSPIEQNLKFHNIHFLSQMNPRSPLVMYGDRSLHNGLGFLYRMYSAPGPPGGINSRMNFNFDAGYVGISTNKDNGRDKMILFQVPEEKPLSIGDLMHANLLNVDSITNTANDGQGWRWNGNYQQPYNTPAYTIGNSFANIHLPLGATYHQIDATTSTFPDWITHVHGVHYDYSYLLNDLLWDDYFFSTNLDGLAEPEFPLPNSRMVKSADEYIPAEMTNFLTAGSNLMLEGGFNINSTSVAAWSSVIGAMRDINTLGAASSDPLTLRHNYSRFTRPANASTGATPSYSSKPNLVDALLSGFRFLSDAQVRRLATEIVREIKWRRSTHGYPFLSLSEFINRSIDRADVLSSAGSLRKRFTYLGALQHAIDQSEINGIPGVDNAWTARSTGTGMWDYSIDNGKSVFISDRATISSSGSYDPETLESVLNRPYLDGAPGSLTQADLLSKIGSLLTPRSDTFTIRGYGHVKDPIEGGVLAESYCEAIVQRTPFYCSKAATDSLGNDKNDVPSRLNDTNLQFGRKFKILSFRWLEAGEI